MMAAYPFYSQQAIFTLTVYVVTKILAIHSQPSLCSSMNQGWLDVKKDRNKP